MGNLEYPYIPTHPGDVLKEEKLNVRLNQIRQIAAML